MQHQLVAVGGRGVIVQIPPVQSRIDRLVDAKKMHGYNGSGQLFANNLNAHHNLMDSGDG
jgi:hypothetical protein